MLFKDMHCSNSSPQNQAASCVIDQVLLNVKADLSYHDGQASMQLEQVGERSSQITCKVAQERRSEGVMWEGLVHTFEYEIVSQHSTGHLHLYHPMTWVWVKMCNAQCTCNA